MTRFEREAREADRRRSAGQSKWSYIAIALASFFLVFVLASWAKSQEFVVTNKMPAFSVENKVLVAADPRGVWSPYWDGREWQPHWTSTKEVKPAAASPFPSPTTPRTIAPSAAGASSGNPGAAQYPVATYTLAPRGTVGGTLISNCPPSG